MTKKYSITTKTPAALIMAVYAVCTAAFIAGALLAPYAAAANDGGIKSPPQSAESKTGFETVPVTIVSTCPAITEILFYIGAGDKIKGVTTLCDYPDSAREIEKIGDLNINYEKLLELKPDAVFLMKGLRASETEILNSFGIKSMELDLSSLDSILDSIDAAAAALKTTKNALQLRKQLKNLSSLINKKQKNIMRSVYFEIWGDPPMTVGGASFINEIITRAHGINIFNEVNIENLSVSLEKVIENNPEVIIAAYDVKTSEIALRPGFSSLIAVKDANIIKIDYNIYVRPAPRILDAVLDLYNKLFPDDAISYEEISMDN
jgi:iron complex transport system substrate-binding protein